MERLRWRHEDVNLIFLIAIPNAEAGSAMRLRWPNWQTTLVTTMFVKQYQANKSADIKLFGNFDGDNQQEENKTT